MTIIAVVVAISALILLLPVAGEPNFGPNAALQEYELADAADADRPNGSPNGL
jgi:hypothetical protein